MADRMTDAECVEALRLLAEYGSNTKAAKALGISRTTFNSRVEVATTRGLTTASLIEDEAARLKTRVKTLEKQLLAVDRDNNTAESVRKVIYGLADATPSPPAWIVEPRPARLPGVPMTLWSDWHFGERVFPEQVGGVNEFDRAIAKARIEKLVKTTCNLALDHMVNPSYPGIVVCLGGDMISGNIHEELRENNDGPVQQSLLELQEHLIAALTAIADRFGKVFVPCVVGNHGRTTMKPRAKGKVYENYEWNLYCQLERWFKAKGDDRLQFFIPGETDAYFNVLGHRFLLTHGDALGVRGGDGIIGALGPICRGAIKVGRSEAQIGRDFDTLLMGHWHTYIPRGEAAPVIVNGALKGYDEYARIFLRVPYSRPSQALWFVHQEHGITAQWQMFLDKRKTAVESAEWISWLKHKG